MFVFLVFSVNAGQAGRGRYRRADDVHESLTSDGAYVCLVTREEIVDRCRASYYPLINQGERHAFTTDTPPPLP